MVSTNMYRALSLGGALFTGLLLLGVTGAFGLTVDTNLFETGVKPGIVMGIWMIWLSWVIYRNMV